MELNWNTQDYHSGTVVVMNQFSQQSVFDFEGFSP